MRASSFTTALVVAVVVCVLLTESSLAEEPALITCTVRIDHDTSAREATAEGLTLEESEEAAIDSACALHCAERLGVSQALAAPAAPDAPQGEAVTPVTPPEDDPVSSSPPQEPDDDEGVDLSGMESCVETCFDMTEVVGTLCWDSSQKTLYVEGVFQTTEESDAPEDNAP